MFGERRESVDLGPRSHTDLSQSGSRPDQLNVVGALVDLSERSMASPILGRLSWKYRSWRRGDMGMSPQEMEAAITKNLAAKTGKSLDEWLGVLHESNLTEKKELKSHLKETHGVGHFQAQTIVSRFRADK